MPVSQVNHGGLAQSVHNSGRATQASPQSSTQSLQQAANQPNNGRVNRRNNRHGKNGGKQQVNQQTLNQPIHGPSSSINRGASNHQARSFSSSKKHGGLLQRMHSSSTVATSSGSHPPQASQAQGLHGGLLQSMNSTSGGANRNTASNTPQAIGTPSDHHQASAQGQLSSINPTQTGTMVMTSEQPKPPKAVRIATLGNFYTLGSSDRDDLWKAMGLKMQKYPAHESWAIPFPAPLNLNQLVLFGFNQSSVYLDERYVRLVYRTHYDNNDHEISRDLLLSPPNPSVNLYDLCFQCAMADAWWKLVRWMDQVLRGNSLNLLDFLKAELKQEFLQKKERHL